MNYLFDIDGVLTTHQRIITQDMTRLIEEFQKYIREKYQSTLYFVTGNDFVKSKDILGELKDYKIFCNNADELRDHQGYIIWREPHIPPLTWHVEDHLITLLRSYKGKRYGQHIVWRTPRFINFSLIGRMCPAKAREKYDKQKSLDRIAKTLENTFRNIKAVRGGQISIDIYSAGADKSRAGDYLNQVEGAFTFIGDKTQEGGNDYPLAQYCKYSDAHDATCITTSGPSETMDLIKGFMEDK